MNRHSTTPSLPFIKIITGWLMAGAGFGGLLFWIGGFMAGAAYFVIATSALMAILGAPLHLLILKLVFTGHPPRHLAAVMLSLLLLVLISFMMILSGIFNFV
ncbi:MAG: hypothetical protein MJK04_21130 [Psychrosphaera sp.]|nr:hypothetical protein [Psychrosphaera sp.]